MLFPAPLRLLLAAALLPVAASANILGNSDAARWRVGQPPPRPWQHSDGNEGATVKIVRHEDANWIALRDASTTVSANLRQEFAPVRAGRLSLRVTLPADHAGDFGIYLGPGNASAAAERVVDIKTNARGMFRLGSAGERIDTALVLKPGESTHLFVEFRPQGDGVHLRLGRIGADGRDEVLGENTFAKPAQPVTRLRITTDNAPQGAHFLVTDLRLTPLR